MTGIRPRERMSVAGVHVNGLRKPNREIRHYEGKSSTLPEPSR